MSRNKDEGTEPRQAVKASAETRPAEEAPVSQESSPSKPPSVEGGNGEVPPDEPEESGVDWSALLEADEGDDDIASLGDLSEAEETLSGDDEPPSDEGVAAEEAVAEDAVEVASAESEESPTPEELVQAYSDGVQPQGEQQAEGRESKLQEQREMTPEELREARERYEAFLVRKYGMSEAEGEELLSAPHEFLPKLVARIHQDVSAELTRSLTEQFRPMVSRELEAREQTKRVEAKFFERWPKLNKPEYRQDLVSLATAYRNAFPDEPVERMIENVGLQGMIRFKIRPDSEQSREEAPKQEPFRPAAPQRAAAPPPTPKQKNPYEVLAEEMLQEDTLY